MGFTLSHPAAVVPFARWLPLSALVAGSVAPDLVLIASLPLAHHYGHVWPGLLYFSLPAAGLLYLGFHGLAKWPLLALCPAVMRTRLAALAVAAGPGRDIRPAPVIGTGKVVLALAVGVATHFVWDTLTHRAGWKPDLIEHWLNDIPDAIHVAMVLQIASSILGLGLLWRWITAWLARAPAGGDAPGVWPERTRIALIALFLILAPLVVAARIITKWNDSFGTWDLVTSGFISFMRCAVCSLIGYCCLWWGRAAWIRIPSLRALHLRALAVFAVFLPEFLLSIARPPSIDNFGFEDGASEVPSRDADPNCVIGGIIGDGWRDNSSWAEVEVAYGLDHDHPHGGGSDQEVNVIRVSSGNVQLVHPRRFHAGVGLRFSVWLRGDQGRTVNVLFQQSHPPWHTYAYKTVHLANTWQEYTVQGAAQEDGDGYLMVSAQKPVHFFVDDVAVTEPVDIPAAAPTGPATAAASAGSATSPAP